MPAGASRSLGLLLGLLLAKGAAAAEGPWALNLEVTTGQQAPSPAPASASAALLVLNSLSEAGRERLGQALHELAVSVARRKNPLFVPLDESDERKAVRNLVAQTAPAFTAANTLLAGQWSSPEGDRGVRPVSRCADQNLCVVLRVRPEDSAEAKRARFLAWPLGYAIVLKLDDGAKLDEVSEALRAPGSNHIALVLTGADVQTLRQSPALLSLQKEARRALSALSGKQTPLMANLAGLAQARSGKNPMPWLSLPAGAILIVPRLGALATVEPFVNEVRIRLRGTPAEWLASPL